MKSLLVVLVFLFSSGFARGQCPQHFVQGVAPEFINPKIANGTTPLCFIAFAVMHSDVSRTPLWSAEHLTASALDEDHQPKRRNTFHAESRLARQARAELRDYAKSGFDRGHMSPSGDMPTVRAQHESFSLANMVPQNPNNNQQLWAAIEESTRTLAKSRGEIYVVTGPLFEGNTLQRLNARVLVPTSLFKAIYDPVLKCAAAYIAPNAPGDVYRTITLDELERRSGIRIFPGVTHNGETIPKLTLPTPQSHHQKTRTRPNFQALSDESK